VKLASYALLLVLLAAGLALRMARGLELHLAPEEASAIPSRWLVDDPDTCLHLRQAELAFHRPRASEVDAFLSHPEGGATPWLPLFDTLVAGYAANLLRETGAPRETGEVHEERLERVAARFGPFLGLFALLATWIVARAAVEGRRREGAALLAAGLVAFAPGAVEASAAARLDVAALGAVLAGLSAWMLVNALRASGTRETLLAGLFAGAASGLACACSLSGVAFFLAGAAALYAHAWRLEGDERRNVLRAGLLFCFVTAFVGQLPPSGVPEEPFGDTALARAWEAALQVPMLAGVPLLAGFVLDQRKGGRFFQAAALVVAIGVILYCFPTLVRTLGGHLRDELAHREWRAACFPRSRGVLDAGSPVGLVSAIAELGPVALLAPWAAWMRLRAWSAERDPVDVLFLAGTLVGLAAWLWDATLLPLALVPMAALCARAAAPVLETLDARRTKVWAAGAALAFAGGAALAWPRPVRGDERTERVEFVRALRWLRGTEPAPGAWNDPEARAAWGVLAPPSAGAAILYHGRRPALATPHALPDALPALREAARALLAADPARLVRYAQGTGARYVVAGPGLLRDAPLLARLASDGAQGPHALESSVLWRLAHGEDSAFAEHGLELAWRSELRVHVALDDGRVAEGPAVSIYAFAAAAATEPRHELRPR
jgi:hypothetical protein